MDVTATPRQAGLVSVIIGTYNAAPYIVQTLDTVMKQTYQQVEVIVVDDGSSDGTWDVLQAQVARHGDRLRTVRQANGGVAAARNAGLALTRGEFIALMDHDDLCMPERLAMQVAVLRQFPEVGLCSTEFSAFHAGGPLARIYSHHYYGRIDPQDGGVARHFQRTVNWPTQGLLPPGEPTEVKLHIGQVYDAVACGNFIHPPTVLFRASLLPEIGLFNLATPLMCDWDWLVRAARITPFAYIDHPLLDYRRSDSQISSERYRKSARLDKVIIARDIVARDPALWQRQRQALRELLIEVHLDAAYGNADTAKLKALGLWWAAVSQYGAHGGEVWGILARILTPQAALQGLRRIKSA
jgi:glycosyltransferase involved in cell wall biosynthesis